MSERVREKVMSQRAGYALRSNLQKAQSARSWLLAVSGRDFDKRQNGVNSKLEGALVGDMDPIWFLHQEKPVHRKMIDMSLAGYQNVEIAKATGYTHTTVANVLKQPWAREYMINQSKKTVQDELREILEKEAIPSIRTLVAVRDDDKARNSDRVTASNALLDRFLGKPVQPMTTDAKPMAEKSDAELMDEVRREMAATTPN